MIGWLTETNDNATCLYCSEAVVMPCVKKLTHKISRNFTNVKLWGTESRAEVLHK